VKGRLLADAVEGAGVATGVSGVGLSTGLFVAGRWVFVACLVGVELEGGDASVGGVLTGGVVSGGVLSGGLTDGTAVVVAGGCGGTTGTVPVFSGWYCAAAAIPLSAGPTAALATAGASATAASADAVATAMRGLKASS
jgi:hypothetical protein